ncbi:hypothetical protein WMY93_019496 [Mugilogobius chulae]|uniref:Uncharacterized protein n=1 Tax=Mugilogobius chulae TaxID=88201 RepID=A0AAW0NFQ3_9GOBI
MRGPYPNHLEDVMDFIDLQSDDFGGPRSTAEAAEGEGSKDREEQQTQAETERGGATATGGGDGPGAGGAKEDATGGQEPGQGLGGAGKRMSAQGSPPQCDGFRPGISDQRGADFPLLQRALCGRGDQLRQDPQQSDAQQEAGQGHALSHLLSANSVRRRLSFLDDNVVYHTLKKHSARKCACV